MKLNRKRVAELLVELEFELTYASPEGDAALKKAALKKAALSVEKDLDDYYTCLRLGHVLGDLSVKQVVAQTVEELVWEEPEGGAS